MLQHKQTQTNKLAISITVMMMTLSFSAVAHNKVVVVPLAGDEAPEEPTAKIVFFTNDQHEGTSFTGSQGADAICAADAEAEDISGVFKALIAEGTDNVGIGRQDFTYYSPIKYVNVLGDELAPDFLGLRDTIYNVETGRIILQANTNHIQPVKFWSGIGEDFSDLVYLSTRCHDWGKRGLPQTGTTGLYSPANDDGLILSNQLFDCMNTFAHLLCFEQ